MKVEKEKGRWTKKTIFSSIIAVILVFVACVVLDKLILNKGKEKEKEILNDEIPLHDKKNEGLIYSNGTVTYENGESIVTVIVTNNQENAIYIDDINIKLYDKDNKIIREILGNVGAALDVGENRTITASITEDLRRTVKVDYEIIK